MRDLVHDGVTRRRASLQCRAKLICWDAVVTSVEDADNNELSLRRRSSDGSGSVIDGPATQGTEGSQQKSVMVLQLNLQITQAERAALKKAVELHRTRERRSHLHTSSQNTRSCIVHSRTVIFISWCRGSRYWTRQLSPLSADDAAGGCDSKFWLFVSVAVCLRRAVHVKQHVAVSSSTHTMTDCNKRNCSGECTRRCRTATTQVLILVSFAMFVWFLWAGCSEWPRSILTISASVSIVVRYSWPSLLPSYSLKCARPSLSSLTYTNHCIYATTAFHTVPFSRFHVPCFPPPATLCRIFMSHIYLFTNDKGRLAPLTCHTVHQTY